MGPVLIIGGLVLVFLVLRGGGPRGGGYAPLGVPTPAPPPWSQVAPPPRPQPNLGLSLEAGVQARTGVPVAALGSMAQAAPLWAKVAVLPIGATAVAQSVITHPVDTVKSIGSTAESVGKKVLGAFGF